MSQLPYFGGSHCCRPLYGGTENRMSAKLQHLTSRLRNRKSARAVSASQKMERTLPERGLKPMTARLLLQRVMVMF